MSAPIIQTVLPVGLIGLGCLGKAIAAHLIDAGFSTVGYDPDETALSGFAQRGGTPVDSPATLAAQASIILTLLPAAEALERALFGPAGLASAALCGPIVVEMSTLGLAIKEDARRRLEPNGVVLLDCPISGTAAQARFKDISIYASGPQAAYERCLPILRCFTRAQHYLGAFGAGTKMKLIANLLVAIHNAAAAEAVMASLKAGIDPALMVKVAGDGAGGSRMLDTRGPMMAARDYTNATLKIGALEKDMRTVREFISSFAIPTPLFNVAQDLFEAAVGAGTGGEDAASVFRAFEWMAEARHPDKNGARQ